MVTRVRRRPAPNAQMYLLTYPDEAPRLVDTKGLVRYLRAIWAFDDISEDAAVYALRPGFTEPFRVYMETEKTGVKDGWTSLVTRVGAHIPLRWDALDGQIGKVIFAVTANGLRFQAELLHWDAQSVQLRSVTLDKVESWPMGFIHMLYSRESIAELRWVAEGTDK